MDNKPDFEDAFNLMCGEKLGSGIHRDVFECRLNDDYVVKVDTEWGHGRRFANILEWEFWNYTNSLPTDSVSKWLAPCHFISPNGKVLIQSRVTPCRAIDDMPKRLPKFLNDVKLDNFGWLNGSVVCVDYALTWYRPNTTLHDVHWA